MPQCKSLRGTKVSKKIVIVGASGHGKVVRDIAKLNGYTEFVFLDDNFENCPLKNEVFGDTSKAKEFVGEDFIVSIGNSAVREKIQLKISEMGLNLVSLIHPKAVVAEDVRIEKGTVVMAGAVINSGAKVDEGCIVNTCSSIDHDCEIGAFCHISVGAHLAGTVKVNKHCWIGIGAVVSNNIEIEEKSTIGAGAVVVDNIKESGTYVGVPARKIK